MEGGAPFGQGAGLVHDQGVDLAQRLDRRRIAKQHALGGCLAGRDHHRHRRGQAQCAGAGDDQHRHRVDEAVGPARLGSEESPHHERGEGDEHDDDDEPARDDIRQALHRRARTLSLRDHLHDLRQHGLCADLLGDHDQRSTGVERGADHLVPGALGHRDRLAGQHRFIDRAFAFVNGTIDGHLFARTNAQPVARMDVGQRDILFGAIRANAPRGLGREAEQRLDRGAGLRARLQLQHLAEQRQRDDHRCCLEIHRHVFAHAERGRKHFGRNRSDDAI